MKNPLRAIDGERIRWQFFNVYLYLVFALLSGAPSAFVTFNLKNGTFVWAEFGEVLWILFSCELILFSPVMILSAANRFFFGKTVCVANRDGLHLPDRTIDWKDISEVVYHPEILNRSQSFCRAVVTVTKDTVRRGRVDTTVEIIHFPLYGLRKIKKYAPNAKIKVKKGLIYFFAVFPTVLGIIIPFFY